ncbi:MAG: tetratricopeptide repeat protein [Corynebacterium sp.]|uniref:tetratricopeptide repeat protein n=1 Tax=Corynebacterium sp. TaxID=1720 RepID=UPI0026DAD07E|nr:tetratricopeptide repeat protein [Corynebacterium sp.]MDO5098277.1 tetratricopeptide repeat protein [Corynebacterium sp.]
MVDHNKSRTSHSRNNHGSDRHGGSSRSGDFKKRNQQRSFSNDRDRREESFGGDSRHRSEKPRPRRHGQDDRRHSNRGGSKQNKSVIHAQRPGYREERINKRVNEPDLPSDLDIRDLDPLVLQDLKVLSKENSTAVAKHMLMAALLMEDDPQLALRHARTAKDRAGRVSVVRETCGIAAYHAGEWKEALSELRAARRMSGGPGLVAVMADCERGLGRPEKAIELAKTEDLTSLSVADRIELGIVVSGARQDLGQVDSAVMTLEDLHPDPSKIEHSWARLSYAYADALLAAGRVAEARTWFEHAASQDPDEYLDARERIAELS